MLVRAGYHAGMEDSGQQVKSTNRTALAQGWFYFYFTPPASPVGRRVLKP